MRKDTIRYEVLESDGTQLKRRKVLTVKGYNDGLVLTYQGDGMLDKVYVGRNYRPLRYKNRYWVGKRLGNNSACQVVDSLKVPLATDVLGPSTDKDCPGDDLSRLSLSDMFGTGVLTVLGKRNIPWLLIGIITVVVIAVIWYLRRGGYF